MLPPMTHRECEEGSGPKTRSYFPVCRLSSSLMTPGSQVTSRLAGSISPMAVRYLEWSMTTASLTVSPDRLVPPPRLRTGAPKRWQILCTATTSSRVRGTTTPIGTWRKLEASWAYRPREAVSKRTSPSTALRSARSSLPTSTVSRPRGAPAMSGWVFAGTSRVERRAVVAIWCQLSFTGPVGPGAFRTRGRAPRRPT